MADKIMKVGVGFGGDIALSVNVSKVKRGLKTVQRVAIPKKVREKKEHQVILSLFFLQIFFFNFSIRCLLSKSCPPPKKRRKGRKKKKKHNHCGSCNICVLSTQFDSTYLSIQAATTIQRIWRGYRARRRTKYFKHK